MDEILIFDDVIEEVEDNESEYEDSNSYYNDFFDSDNEYDNDAELVREESDVNVSDGEPNNSVYSGLSSDNVSYDQVVSMNFVPVPISGDNVINNYYEVSDNTLSYNLMNKPINEYNVVEGLSLMQFLLFCSVGLVLLIRRCIYQWK